MVLTATLHGTGGGGCSEDDVLVQLDEPLDAVELSVYSNSSILHPPDVSESLVVDPDEEDAEELQDHSVELELERSVHPAPSVGCSSCVPFFD